MCADTHASDVKVGYKLSKAMSVDLCVDGLSFRGALVIDSGCGSGVTLVVRLSSVGSSSIVVMVFSVFVWTLIWLLSCLVVAV